jgi:hypothetical protein
MKNSNPIVKPAVIPAQAGIQVTSPIDVKGSQPYELDSRLRGNDSVSGLQHFSHRL